MVSKSKKRLLIFILLAVISGFLLYKIVSFYAQSFGPGTIYRQSDPRWANHRVGGSRQTLKAVGCMVCCVSMALEHYGFHFNPAQLNELLKDHGGYSSSGLLQWGAIPKITDNEIEVLPYEKPGLDFIDNLSLQEVSYQDDKTTFMEFTKTITGLLDRRKKVEAIISGESTDKKKGGDKKKK